MDGGGATFRTAGYDGANHAIQRIGRKHWRILSAAKASSRPANFCRRIEFVSEIC
jgi:hypothetical protein